MRPCEILHEVVQNIPFGECQVKLAVISQITFAITRAVFYSKFFGQHGDELSAIFSSCLTALLFFDNTASDIPKCCYCCLTCCRISCFPALLYDCSDIADKCLTLQCYIVICHNHCLGKTATQRSCFFWRTWIFPWHANCVASVDTRCRSPERC